MAIKKVKLTEADLNRIVNKVIEEQGAIQNAANYVGGAIKSGANAINNATGGMAGKVAKSVVDTAKSVGNALTTKQITPQQQRINNIARMVKQYKITPQEFAAAQKLNSGGGVAQAARKAAPVAAKPQNYSNGLTDGGM